MTIVAGSPFTIDYFPSAGGVTYDPSTFGGNVTLLQVYSDAGRTTLVTSAGPATRIASGQYRFSVGALGAGTYYTKVTWLPATGGTNVVDANDTLVVAAADGTLGAGLGASTSQALNVTAGGTYPVPYLTPAQWKAMPTAVSVSSLVQGGSQQVQDQALLDVILRASRWCDNEANRMLGADAYVDTVMVTAMRGVYTLKAKAEPVQRVTAVSLGPTPQFLSALTDLSGVWLEDDYTISVPVSGSSSSWMGSLGISSGQRGQTYAVWAYEAGFPCMHLAADAAQGAMTIGVDRPVGVMPGMTLTVTDAEKSEVVTVAAGYTGGSATVPLTAPLAQAHTAGTGPGSWVGVSAMPADLWEATALVTSGIIKGRGANTVTTTQTGGIGKSKGAGSVDLNPEFDRARQILSSYARTR